MSEIENAPGTLTEQPPAVISQSWKWLTVGGNAAIGAAELATGNFSTLSVTADGVHNAADTATYYMQAETILNPDLNDEQRQHWQKMAYWIISLTSAGLGLKAGLDLALDQEHTGHEAALYTASASLALNGLMLARMWQGIKRRGTGVMSVYEAGLVKHFLRVDMLSAGLAVAGAVLQKYNVDIEQAAAVASGTYGAYEFRPTKKNLGQEHACLSHDHKHGHGHGHRPAAAETATAEVSEKSRLARYTHKLKHRKEKPRAFSGWRRVVGTAVAASALVTGLLSGDSTRNDAVQEVSAGGESLVSAAVPQSDLKPSQTQEGPAPINPYVCLPIMSGDSQWRIIQHQLTEATGNAPAKVTNAIVNFTAVKNKQVAPDPEQITSDNCLQTPGRQAMITLRKALEQPDTSQLTADLQSLNRQPDWAAVMARQPEAIRIDLNLQRAAS